MSDPNLQVAPKWKLTPARRERICALIKNGAPQITAIRSCGIGESTFYDWMTRGRKGLRRAIEEGLVEEDRLEEAYAVAELTKQHKLNPVGELLRSAGWPEADIACVELVIDIERSNAEAEAVLALRFRQLAQDDAKALAKFMAVRWPERWSETRRVRMHVNGEQDVRVRVEVRAELAHAIVADPEARSLATALLARVVPAGGTAMAEAELLELLAGEDDDALPVAGPDVFDVRLVDDAEDGDFDLPEA